MNIKMTSDVKNLCERIERYMRSYRDDNHGLLYEKTLYELTNINFSGIFIKIANLPLFRVRLNGEKNTLFDKVRDIQYAPTKCICSYGRVNKPGQSMFYCSEFPSICGLELLHDYLLKNKIGHERFATYSEWKIQKELYLLVLGIAPSHQELINGFTIRDDCFKFVKSEPKDSQETYSNLYTLTSKFFLKNAKKDYSVYVVCSAIANFFTLCFSNIDGFIYPSVQGNTGYNIVLRPHVIDNKKILPKNDLTMKKWIISKKDLMSLDPDFNKIGHIDDDDIRWNN